jgi:hypothetical protein
LSYETEYSDEVKGQQILREETRQATHENIQRARFASIAAIRAMDPQPMEAEVTIARLENEIK